MEPTLFSRFAAQEITTRRLGWENRLMGYLDKAMGMTVKKDLSLELTDCDPLIREFAEYIIKTRKENR